MPTEVLDLPYSSSANVASQILAMLRNDEEEEACICEQNGLISG